MARLLRFLRPRLGELVATLEVAGEDVGAQVEAEKARLTGITYDNKDDILVIGLDAIGGTSEDLERVVEKPQAIYLETEDGGVMTFDIEDAEGHKTLLRRRRAAERRSRAASSACDGPLRPRTASRRASGIGLPLRTDSP